MSGKALGPGAEVCPLWVEIRLHRWMWAGTVCSVLVMLSWWTRAVAVSVPVALRQVSAPEVSVMIAVVLAVHPLLDWLPLIAPGYPRARRLRAIRSVTSAGLVLAVSAPAIGEVRHIVTFGLLLWALTVVSIVLASGELAWTIPLIGGMALFLSDGGYATPISDALAREASLLAAALGALLVGALYVWRGPRTRVRATQ